MGVGKFRAGEITWVSEDGRRAVISPYDSDAEVHLRIDDVAGKVAALKVGMIVKFTEQPTDVGPRALRTTILS
jgi:cold shock CspA family protein